MKFPPSQFALSWLAGLNGVEIGGSAHNPSCLNTVNVDQAVPQPGTPYYEEQMNLCGEVLPVDFIGRADALPFPDKSYDFVYSTHVIEHCWDPIAALREMCRVAKYYVFLTVPQPTALPSDVGKPLTTLDDIHRRHNLELPDPGTDEHHSRWTCPAFVEMCRFYGFNVLETQDPDDKVGNGFSVLIQVFTTHMHTVSTKKTFKIMPGIRLQVPSSSCALCIGVFVSDRAVFLTA